MEMTFLTQNVAKSLNYRQICLIKTPFELNLSYLSKTVTFTNLVEVFARNIEISPSQTHDEKMYTSGEYLHRQIF